MKGITDIDEGTIRRIDWQELMPGTMLLRSFSMALKIFIIVSFSLFLSLAVSCSSKTCRQDLNIMKIFGGNSSAADSSGVRNETASEAQVAQKVCPAEAVKTLVPWKPSLCHFLPGQTCRSRDTNTEITFSDSAVFVLILFVFSILGMMLARASGVRLASTERSGLADSLKYTLDNYKSLVLICFISGILIFIPAAAAEGCNWLAGIIPCRLISAALFPFKELFAFLHGLMFVLTVAAFPLMIAAVAVDHSDGFDAVSRGFSYVLSRPVHYAVYLTAAAVLAAFGILLINFIVRESVLCLAASSFKFPTDAPTGWYLFWIRTLLMTPFGFALAFLITAETTIYLALRQSVDGTPVATWHSNSSHKPSRKLAPILDDAAQVSIPDELSKSNPDVKE